MTDYDPQMIEAMRAEIFGNSTFDTDTCVEHVRIEHALRLIGISPAALNALWRGEAVVISIKHNHVDNRRDTRCAKCGHDLRHSIHLRVGESVPDLSSTYAETKDG